MGGPGQSLGVGALVAQGSQCSADAFHLSQPSLGCSVFPVFDQIGLQVIEPRQQTSS